MKKRMIVLFLGFALVGCSSNSANSNSEDDVVYETYERAALEEDIMDGNTLERYAAVDCDVVEVKMISQDQKEEVIDTDGEEENIEFALYEMEIKDVVSSSDLSVGDTIVIAVADWMSEEYPTISADMTYIIPVYKADEESVNVGNYLIADYSLFYVIDKTDGTQTIKAAYVEDESYDGLSIDEFKNQLETLGE